ncbi:MAG TPA: hypothetical protein VFS43_30865 [Polyangiaceae bacterium]|nr:hypothetical protein [Polyangiaceae bacterium]
MKPNRMPTVRPTALLLTALCSLLAGCPDPTPVLVVVGAETARESDGSVRVNAIVSNNGYHDFDGTFCVTARWLRGVEGQPDEAYRCGKGEEPLPPVGEVVDEATACVERELEREEDAFFELRSSRPLEGDDLVIAISVSHHSGDEAYVSCAPTLLGMPPAP